MAKKTCSGAWLLKEQWFELDLFLSVILSDSEIQGKGDANVDESIN